MLKLCVWKVLERRKTAMAACKALSVSSSVLCDVTCTVVSNASLCTCVSPLAVLLIQRPCEYTPCLLLRCLLERSLKEKD